MAIKTKSSTSKVEKKTMICKNGCSNKSKVISNFYESNLEEYKVYGGYVPICKECLRKMAIDTTLNTVTMDSIKSVLKRVDKPFVEDVFVAVKNKKDKNGENITNDKILGDYIKTLNCYPKYRGLVYSDTIDIQIEQEKIMNSKVESYYSMGVTDEMREFWGYGKPDEKYIALQKKFDKFMDNETEELDYKKELDYKTLTELEILKQDLMGNPDKVGDLAKVIDMISKLSSDLNIKAIQKKEDKNNNRHYIIGVITKFIEDVKKEPILKPSDYMKGYTKTEFEKELELYFTAPLLDSFEMNNPFKEEWENDKKKYEPTKEEIDAFANNKGDDE